MSDPWSWSALALVSALVLAYLRGLRVRAVLDRESAVALLGLAVLGVSISPPAHALAERGLMLHMAQHVALVIAAAPLIVLGRPLPTLLLGLPRAVRPLVARLAPGRWLLGATGIWVVTALHAGAFWLWHDPALYDAAVRDGSLHALEHASFVLSALLYWWSIVHAEREGERGVVLAMVASVATVIQGSMLGLLMLVAHAPWYSVYPSSGDALGQQQAAAALMWATTGSVYMLASAILLWRLLAQLDRRTA